MQKEQPLKYKKQYLVFKQPCTQSTHCPKQQQLSALRTEPTYEPEQKVSIKDVHQNASTLAPKLAPNSTQNVEQLFQAPNNRIINKTEPNLLIQVEPKSKIDEDNSLSNTKTSTKVKNKKKHWRYRNRDYFNDNIFSDWEKSAYAIGVAAFFHLLILAPIFLAKPSVHVPEEQQVIEIALIDDFLELKPSQEPALQSQLFTSQKQEVPTPSLTQPVEQLQDDQKASQVEPTQSIDKQKTTLEKNKKDKTHKTHKTIDKSLMQVNSEADVKKDNFQQTSANVEDKNEQLKMQSALLPFLVYPQQAIDNNVEGTTILLISFNENGAISRSSIVQSSGSDLLDKAALKALSFLPLFKEKANDSMILPVEFSLN